MKNRARALLLATSGVVSLVAVPAAAQTAPERPLVVGDGAADAAPQTAPAAAPVPVQAEDAPQSSESTSGGDIIITARRRDERLMDVPVAVSVISGDTLTQRGVTRPQDIANLTPGLSATPASGVRNGAAFSIRGQGGSSSNVTGASGVATYLDEVPEFGTLNIPSNFVPLTVELFDIDDVQVLKGPQGTLFGKVTTGGAVLLKSRMPGNTFQGFVTARVGAFDQRDVEFGVGGPVIPDILGVRVAGISHYSRGWVHNLYNNEWEEGANNQHLRITAKLTLGKLTNTTILQYSHNQDDQRTQLTGLLIKQPIIDRPIPSTIAALAGISCANGCPTWYNYQVGELAISQARGPDVIDNNNYGLNPEFRRKGVINSTNWEISKAVTLRNIFSYRDGDIIGPGSNAAEGSRLPITELWTLPWKGTRTTTEEFQIQAQPFKALSVTAGVYYERSFDPDYYRQAVLTLGGYGSSVIAPTASSTPAQITAYNNCATNPNNNVSSGYCHLYTGISTRQSRNEATDKAAYIQANLDITDKLTVTGGYRWTDSSRKSWTGPTWSSIALRNPGAPASEYVQIPGSIRDLVPADPGGTIAGVVPVKVTAKVGTYTAAIRYEVNRNLMFYATTRTGFKPGGFNTAAPAGQQQFGPEHVTDYEIGSKISWRIAGVSGFTTIDVYRDNYDDIQRTTSALVNNATTTFTFNIAKARIQGFDIDTTIKFSKAFDMALSYSLTDAKYLEYPNNGQTTGVPLTFDYTTNLLSGVSKHKWTVTPSVHLKGFNSRLPDISVSGNVYFQGRYAFIDLNSTVQPFNILPGRTLADARIDWNKIAGSNFSLGFAVNNIGDYRGQVSGNNQSFTLGHAYAIYNPPRSYFLELRYAL